MTTPALPPPRASFNIDARGKVTVSKATIRVPRSIVARLLELDAVGDGLRIRHPETLADTYLRDVALALDQLRLAVGDKVP